MSNMHIEDATARPLFVHDDIVINDSLPICFACCTIVHTSSSIQPCNLSIASLQAGRRPC